MGHEHKKVPHRPYGRRKPGISEELTEVQAAWGSERRRKCDPSRRSQQEVLNRVGVWSEPPFLEGCPGSKCKEWVRGIRDSFWAKVTKKQFSDMENTTTKAQGRRAKLCCKQENAN